MISFLLDTDTLQLFQDQHPAVVTRVLSVPLFELAISVITVEEQLAGWYTQLRQAKNDKKLAWAYRRLADVIPFLTAFGIMNFDESAIRRYRQLERLKLKIRKMDLRIAACALDRDITLVTRNKSDFQRVPGLRIEDWSK